MEHVAITGMGVVSPVGGSVDVFWKNLCDGRCAIARIPGSDELSGSKLWAATPDDAMDQALLPAAALRNTDRFTRYAMYATAQALRHARLEPPARTAVIVGSTMGGLPFAAQTQEQMTTDGPRSVTPKLMALVIPNMACSRIALHWKLHGPQLAISTACASSLDAIGIAAGMIERSEIDVAIAGGTETLLAPVVYESLERAGALSRNTDPARASRPFDRERDGFVMGDGGAILILERTEHAQARGAGILARVRGYGSLADAYHITSPDPSAAYERQAMCDAMDEAGEAARCGVVFAHGTSTPLGDAAEAKAIRAAYAPRVPLVTSIKGHIGHSMAAAGAMSIIAGVMGMRDGMVPQTLGTEHVDPACDLDVVLGRTRAHAYDVFQANAFGFGGQNASVVISA